MIDRRSILRGALFGAGLSAFPRRVVAATSRSIALGSPTVANQKVLFVFLRGGLDGVNTLIPYGDLDYPAARPLLQIPIAGTHGLQGVTYSRLEPNLYRLLTIDQAGRFAGLHQIGTNPPSRSHFTAMDMFETMSLSPITQAELATKHGFVPRLMTTIGAPTLDASSMPAAISISQLMQRMFRAGDSIQLSAHARSLQKELLALPFPMADTGIPPALTQHALSHYAAPVTAVDQTMGANLAFGVIANGSLESLQFDHAAQFAATSRFPSAAGDLASLLPTLQPLDAAVLPAFDPKGAAFLAAAEQAVFALTHVPGIRVAGVEFGGFDTHADENLDLPNLLRYLGWGLRDLDDEIQAAGLGGSLTVIVVTEFGRTANENSGLGTDHGAGGAGFAIGGRVRGGTYNVRGPNPAPREFGFEWRRLLDPTVLPDTPYYDACDIKTDFRDIIAEVAHTIFLVPLTSLSQVVPGYPASNATFLNFLV